MMTKKNRLDSLPSELVILVYSFLDEQERHKDAIYTNLRLDSEFRSKMWELFYTQDNDAIYTRGENNIRYEKNIYEHIDKHDNFTLFLPSEILIDSQGDNFEVFIRQEDNCLPFRYRFTLYHDDEIRSLVAEYIEEDDGLCYLCENLLSMGLTDKARSIGFTKEDVIRLKEKEDSETLKKICDAGLIADSIVDDGLFEEEYMEHIFYNDYSFTVDGFCYFRLDNEGANCIFTS
jgi:hypothetical protein